jgi:hypothetical protein
MKSRVMLTLSSAGALLTAGIALAGLLPDPPFTTGGFNPPDATVLKQEQSVGKVITKYVGSRTKCDHKAIGSLQKSHLAVDPAGIAAAQAAWTACVGSANAKYIAARDKLILGGTPACLNAAGIDGIKNQLDVQLPALGGAVFCEATFGNDPVSLLNVPATAAFAKAEIAVAKVATKAGTGARKCYTKAAATVNKNLGTLPAADLIKFNDCLAKAAAGGAAAVAKLVAGGTLPGCLPGPTADLLVSAAVTLGGSFNDETYCQSPSGAFID